MRICLLAFFGWKKTSIRLYRPRILWKDPLSKREPRQSLLGASVRKIRFTRRGIKLRLSSIPVSNAFSLSLALYYLPKAENEAFNMKLHVERINIF